MVAFDDKGQGYWEFIIDNCTDDFIKAIKKELLQEVEVEILLGKTEIFAVKETDYVITVFLKRGTTFIIYEFYRRSETRFFNKDYISIDNMLYLKDLGVI